MQVPWRTNTASHGDGEGSHGARNLQERIACIVNPAARGGRVGRRIDELRRGLDRAFAEWLVRVTEGPGDARRMAAELAAEDLDIVAAVGGDGTASEVVAGLFEGSRPRNRRIVFAQVPWGTGSDLARSLRTSPDLERALWTAATGMTIPTDVVHLEATAHDGSRFGRVFINVGGFGVNGSVVERANRSSKRLGGGLTFLGATVAALRDWRPPEVEVRWRGPEGEGVWTGRLLAGFVANGGWCGGGMWVGRGGSMHDGLLDLTVVPALDPLALVVGGRRLYTGTLDRVPGVVRVGVAEVEVRSDGGRVPLDIDGEQPGSAPAHFRVLPGALQVRGGWVRSPLPDPERPTWRPA